MLIFILGWVCGASILLLGQYCTKIYQEEVKKTSPSQIFKLKSYEWQKAFIEGFNEGLDSIKK